MGYFRRKPRRQRERAHKERLRLGHEPGATVLTRARTYDEWRYLRVAVPAWHWDIAGGQGLFTAAGEVQDTRVLEPDPERAIAAALRWFRDHLPLPGRLRDRKAIFWFKQSAAEHCRRAVHLARRLRALGIVVEITRTSEPGRIVWEDEQQIAAVPPAPPATS